MIDELMPDFVEALEQRLRNEAAAPNRANQPSSKPRGARHWIPRIAIPAAGSLALAGVILAISASNDHQTQTAFGKPLILQTSPVDAAKVMQEVQGGMSVMLRLGKGALLTAARPVTAFGGTAYVLTGDRGWCLTAPDPAVGDPAGADPARRGAVTCARTDDVYKYGIALGVGNNAIAAIPQGVQDPRLTAPDGATRDLAPSGQGVVVADNVQDGSVLTLYGPDGTTRSLHLQHNGR